MMNSWYFKSLIVPRSRAFILTSLLLGIILIFSMFLFVNPSNQKQFVQMKETFFKNEISGRIYSLHVGYKGVIFKLEKDSSWILFYPIQVLWCTRWKWKNGKEIVGNYLEAKMANQKKFSSEEKVSILREHLDDRLSISELSEKYGISPNIIYLWKKQMFENASILFERKSKKSERETSQDK